MDADIHLTEERRHREYETNFLFDPGIGPGRDQLQYAGKSKQSAIKPGLGSHDYSPGGRGTIRSGNVNFILQHSEPRRSYFTFSNSSCIGHSLCAACYREFLS
jgi:hypothetical protein